MGGGRVGIPDGLDWAVGEGDPTRSAAKIAKAITRQVVEMKKGVSFFKVDLSDRVLPCARKTSLASGTLNSIKGRAVL
jgi:hypothetical protein